MLDIMALITGVGMPPRQAIKGTDGKKEIGLEILINNYHAAILTCFHVSMLP